MKRRVMVKLPDGSEISLFAARCKYRKTQCLILFSEIRIFLSECRIILSELHILLHYLFVRFEMFIEGFSVPQCFRCRVPRLQKIYNKIKVIFYVAHGGQSDAKNNLPASHEK